MQINHDVPLDKKNALANDDQLARRYQFYELKGWELNDDFRNGAKHF